MAYWHDIQGTLAPLREQSAVRSTVGLYEALHYAQREPLLRDASLHQVLSGMLSYQSIEMETPISGIPRVTTGDLAGAGYEVPAGSYITMSVPSADRAPRRFPEPDRFDDTRHLTFGEFLRKEYPNVARSMDRFIDRIRAETHGEIIGELQVVRIPLDLYRAPHVTSLAWRSSGIDHPLAQSAVFLLGDSALGSPYFQSISLGLEAAYVLTRHLTNREQSIEDVQARYEDFMYRQWLRVYMRTQMIKHNKDLLECVGDSFRLLERMHVY